MERPGRIGTALAGIASLCVAGKASGSAYVEPCGTAVSDYRSLVQRLMREALPSSIAPLVIRYAELVHTETGVGISSDSKGYYLVRLVFDQSLYYDSIRHLERMDIQDFSLVHPRIEILSIPISDRFAADLIEMLEGFSPAGPLESGPDFVTDGVLLHDGLGGLTPVEALQLAGISTLELST